MTRVASEKQYNSFVKGLVTEASPLTFPENAFLDGDNIVLKKNGGFSRRLGIDYEDGYTLASSGFSGASLLETERSFHKWNFAGGDPNISLGVVRVSNKLYFLDMTSVSPSSSLKNGGSPIVISGLANAPIETTVVNGGLVVISSDIATPVFLEYVPSTDTVSQSNITLKVRDFWGVDDGEVVDTRPVVLTDSHKYNLLNQGWPTAHITTVAYPSNADIWTLGKDTSDTFSLTLLQKNSTDKSYAPKGKYIIDLFARGASRVIGSGVVTLPLDAEQGKLSSVATYAGRVFYTGISSQVVSGDKRSPGYSGYIFFSKTVASKDDLGKCYQEADPTSETISDIIATDGGTINILDANKILRLVPTKNSLIAFAENGIWEIYGSDAGFKATEYQMSKITNVGISNSKSIVVAGDTIFYWAKNGIYAITAEQVSGRFQSQSISLTTIQTYYDNLPSDAKANAKGFYDEKENVVRWLYSSDTDDEYNRELVLDISLQAFYTNSILNNTVFVADYVEVPSYINNTGVEDVYADDELVLVGTDIVQVSSYSYESRNSVFSFLTFNTSGEFTLSKYSNTGFLDWYAAEGGVDYSSYLVTGYELFGDMMRKKQATYLVMMLERTEDGFTDVGGDLIPNNQSSCLVQAQWNWTNSTASGKWGSEFQAYRYVRPYVPSGTGDSYNTGDRVIHTKNKLRGSGRALSLYIHSEEGKDMKVFGWSIPMTGNSTV